MQILDRLEWGNMRYNGLNYKIQIIYLLTVFYSSQYYIKLQNTPIYEVIVIPS